MRTLELAALRQIVGEMPNFDLARFDKLEGYTLALGNAHTLYLAASTPTESLEDIWLRCCATTGPRSGARQPCNSRSSIVLKRWPMVC
jgi:hypothetical protein